MALGAAMITNLDECHNKAFKKEKKKNKKYRDQILW